MQRVEEGVFSDAIAGRAAARSDIWAYASLAGVGLFVEWLSATHPSILPPWAPWDFSAPAFAVAALASWWYLRGVGALDASRRPSLLRRICYFAGVAVIYAVVQTRFEYMAQHMFVLNRIQHVVMHHLGPMLIVLAWPGAALRLGMPTPVRRLLEHRALVSMVRLVQRPAPAAILFVGLIFFWLIPPIHFRAMIDRNLYWTMNWSMIVDGVLFWSLVLDPRPSPPASLSFVARGALALGVMFPQIAGGAAIAFSRTDLYSYYDLCGRLYPALGPMADQQLGGLVIWIPAAMMSAIALLLVFERFRRAENQGSPEDEHVASIEIRAR
jgi:putative membrane protein